MQVDAILFTRQLSKHLMVAPAFKLAKMHKLDPCPHAQAPCCGREFRPACDSAWSMRIQWKLVSLGTVAAIAVGTMVAEMCIPVTNGLTTYDHVCMHACSMHACMCTSRHAKCICVYYINNYIYIYILYTYMEYPHLCGSSIIVPLQILECTPKCWGTGIWKNAASMDGICFPASR